LSAGQLRLDFSTEYIEQDQPWVGYHPVEVGAVMRPDHQEVETTNLTWKLGAELAPSDRWSVSLLVPLVHREHLHLEVENHGGDGAAHEGHEDIEPSGAVTIGKATGIPQRWNFTALGDVHVAVRYIILRPAEPGGTTLSAFAGVKLPTGKTDECNDAGQEAEIAMQPGTGSVDPLAGATLQRGFSIGEATRLPAFFGVAAHTPGTDGRFGYRPGTELLLNAGAAYPLTSKLSALGQINFRYKDRDHVGRAPGELAADTGGEYLYVSPGLQAAILDGLALYSYVQVPVLQRVNGIQLVSRWNLLVGLSYQMGT
jgi:hypothetical protein